MAFLKASFVVAMVSSLASLAGASPRGNNILRRIFDEVDEYIDPWADSSPAVIMSTGSDVIPVPVSPTIIRSMESDVISVPVTPTVIQSTASDVIFVPVSPTSISPSASHVVYVPVVFPTIRSTASDVISVPVSSTTNLPTASNVVFVPVSPTTLSTVSSVVSVPVKDQPSSTSSTDKSSSAALLISTPTKDQSSLKDSSSSTATLVSLLDKDKVTSTSDRIISTLITGYLMTCVPDKDNDKFISTVLASDKNSDAVITGSLVISVPHKDNYTWAASIPKTISIATTSGFVTGVSDQKNWTSVSASYKISGGVIPDSIVTNVPDKNNFILTAWTSDRTTSAVVSSSTATGIPDKDKSTFAVSVSDKISVTVISSSVVTAIPDKDKDKYISTASKDDKISRAVISGSTRTVIPEKTKPNSIVSISDKVCVAVITSSIVIGIPDKDKDKDKLISTISTSDRITSAAASISSANGVSDKSSLESSSGIYDKIGSPSLFASISSDKDRPSSATSISTRGEKINTYISSSPASPSVSDEHKPTLTPLLKGKPDSSDVKPSLSIAGNDQISSSPRILVPTQETNAVPAKDHSYFSSQTSSTKFPTYKDQPYSSFTNKAKISSPLQVASITTIPDKDQFPNPSPAKYQITSSLAPGKLLSSSSSVLNYIPEKDQVTFGKSKSVPAKDQATLASISVPAQYQSISISVPANSLVPIKDASESIVGSIFVGLSVPTPTKDENIYTHSGKDEATFSVATATSLSRTETDTLVESFAETTPLLVVSSTNSESLYYISIPEVSKQRSVSPPNYGLRSKSKAPFLNITSTVIPIWTPAMLGNAYGGGYVTTPSVFVTSFPDSPRPSPGIPPGYELSSEDSQSPKYIPTLVSVDVQETTSVPEGSTPGALLTKSDDKTSKLIDSATTSALVPVGGVPTEQETTDTPIVSTLSNYGPKDKVGTPGSSNSLATSRGTGFTPPSFISKDEPNTPTIATLSAPGLFNDNSDKSVSPTQPSALKVKDEADETSYPSSFEFPAFSKVTLATTTKSKDEKDTPTAFSVLPSAGGSITRLTGSSLPGKGGNNSVILALSPTSVPEFQGFASKHTMSSTIGLVCLSVLMFFF